MWFGINLVRKGYISPEQFVEAAEKQLRSRDPIGRLAMITKKLTMSEVFSILNEQAISEKPFGQIAIALGFLTEDDVARLLLVQSDRQTSIADILLEMGAIDQEVVDREVLNYRVAMLDRIIHDQPAGPSLVKPHKPAMSLAH